MAMSEAEYVAAMEEVCDYLSMRTKAGLLIEHTKRFNLQRRIPPEDRTPTGWSRTSPTLNRQLLFHMRRYHDLLRGELRSLARRKPLPTRLQDLLIQMDADAEALAAEGLVMAAEELTEACRKE